MVKHQMAVTYCINHQQSLVTYRSLIESEIFSMSPFIHIHVIAWPCQNTWTSYKWIIVAAIPSVVILWPCQNIWISYKWLIVAAIPSVAVVCAGLAVCIVHWGGTSDKLVTCLNLISHIGHNIFLCFILRASRLIAKISCQSGTKVKAKNYPI